MTARWRRRLRWWRWRWLPRLRHERRHDPRPLYIRRGRNPFQRFVMGCGVFSGLAGLTGGPGLRSQALVNSAPPLLLMIYYVALTLSSGAVLILILPREHPVDMFNRAERDALRMRLQYEAVGLASLACVSLGFSAMVLAWAGSNGLQVAVTYAAFLFAAIARIREITVDLRKMARAVEHPTLLDTPTVADPGGR